MLVAMTLLALTACTWVKDDNDDCLYGFWLNLHYTYNILDVEAAPRYLKGAYVYVYGTDGQFVKRIDVQQAALTAEGFRVRVDDLPEGDYQFVVWSGIANSQYALAGDMQPMDEFRLLLTAPGAVVTQQLGDVFYGYLHTVHYDSSYASHDVSMIKDTNQLACLLVSVDGEELTPDDYTMTLTATNGVLNGYNAIVADEATVYEPFVAEESIIDDPDYGTLYGAKFGISTLRLLSDGDSRITLMRKSTQEPVLSIMLPEYIGMIGSLYTNLGQPLTLQEYLDRQDFYTIVFYIAAETNQLIQLKVNNWRLRASNHLKL